MFTLKFRIWNERFNSALLLAFNAWAGFELLLARPSKNHQVPNLVPTSSNLRPTSASQDQPVTGLIQEVTTSHMMSSPAGLKSKPTSLKSRSTVSIQDQQVFSQVRVPRGTPKITNTVCLAITRGPLVLSRFWYLVYKSSLLTVTYACAYFSNLIIPINLLICMFAIHFWSSKRKYWKLDCPLAQIISVLLQQRELNPPPRCC